MFHKINMKIVLRHHSCFYMYIASDACNNVICVPLLSAQKIDAYQNLAKEIASLHITVPLNMLCLNCNDVNQELAARAARLADKMIHYVVDQNRDKNRGYVIVCLKYLTLYLYQSEFFLQKMFLFHTLVKWEVLV